MHFLVKRAKNPEPLVKWQTWNPPSNLAHHILIIYFYDSEFNYLFFTVKITGWVPTVHSEAGGDCKTRPRVSWRPVTELRSLIGSILIHITLSSWEITHTHMFSGASLIYKMLISIKSLKILPISPLRKAHLCPIWRWVCLFPKQWVTSVN